MTLVCVAECTSDRPLRGPMRQGACFDRHIPPAPLPEGVHLVFHSSATSKRASDCCNLVTCPACDAAWFCAVASALHSANGVVRGFFCAMAGMPVEQRARVIDGVLCGPDGIPLEWPTSVLRDLGLR